MEATAHEIYEECLMELSEKSLEFDSEEFRDLLTDIILYYWKDGKYHSLQKPQPQKIRSQKNLLRKSIEAMNNHKMDFNKYWISLMQYICTCIEEKQEMDNVKDQRMKARQQVKALQAKLNNETHRCGLCGSDDLKFKNQCREDSYNNLPHGEKEWAEHCQKIESKMGKWMDRVSELEEIIKENNNQTEKNENDNMEQLQKIILDKSEQIDKKRKENCSLKEENKQLKLKIKTDDKKDNKKDNDVIKLNEKIIKQDILITELKKNKSSTNNDSYWKNKCAEQQKTISELESMLN